MQSQGNFSERSWAASSKEAIENKWNDLSESQQQVAIKCWKILTFKWQWQIAMNLPFLMIWMLDKTIPAVHLFNLKLIASMPIPELIKSWINLN